MLNKSNNSREAAKFFLKKSGGKPWDGNSFWASLESQACQKFNLDDSGLDQALLIYACEFAEDDG